jgi:hypothetical protein
MAPVVGLYLAAPFIAEFLMGNISITVAFTLPLVGLLYGCGALLIREFARHAGGGWPMIMTLGLAYGMYEESFPSHTFWAHEWVGHRILDYGYLPVPGTGLSWLMFMAGVHTVWSICIPIALVETLAGPRLRTTRWLGRTGMIITGALFFIVFLPMAIWSHLTRGDWYATVPQLILAALVVVALVALAVWIGRRNHSPLPGTSPSPWIVGLAGLIGSAIFVLLYAVDPTGISPWLAGLGVSIWLTVGLYLAVFATMIILVNTWSRQNGWNQAHVLALAGGGMLTYAWHSFPWPSLTGASPAVDLIGNAIFSAIAIALWIIAAQRLRREHAAVPIDPADHDLASRTAGHDDQRRSCP